MFYRRFNLALLTLLLTALPLSAQVQNSAGAWAEWETITPEGEEFTVTMPKNPTTEAAKFPYHRMELNSRLYLAKSSTGPILAIVSFSGIKSNSAPEFERFNSYIDAFKDFFPPKVRTKDTALTKLTLVSSRPFHGNTGRSYKLSIGEFSGVVHAFVTRKRFYAIVSLNTKPDAALEEKFLSSFTLPERVTEQPKTTASAAQPVSPETELQPQQQQSQEKPKPEGEAPKTEETPNSDPNAANNTVSNQVPPPADPNQKRGPLQGGVLNGKAIYLPKPETPAGEASGVVLVQVLVDEQGMVIDARPLSGPAHLQAAAATAARLARFSPTLVSGVPVQVSGILSYNFMRAN